MKKKLFTLPFKSNFFKEQDPFHLVIIFFIIFFSTAIFFSIPTFFDYEKYNQKIEETINNEFKVKLYNLENISFKFIPSPHLIIKKAEFKIKQDETDSIGELSDIKVFISIIELYKSDDFKIKKMIINKANFYFKEYSFLNLIENLKKNLVNKLIIKNSTFFFKDKKDEVILISTIKKLEYKIDFKSNKKILDLNGNIFDTNYKFTYLIDYKKPNIQNLNIEFNNPNLQIENTLEENFLSEKKEKKGIFKAIFLNKTNSINYNIEGNNLSFSNSNTKNSNFDLNGLINFSPFHFNLILDINDISSKTLENIFYSIYKNQNLAYENLSGNILIKFNKINNKLIGNGSIDLLFQDSKLSLKNNKFYIDDFADLIISDYKYLDDSEQVIETKVELNIKNSQKFNKFIYNYQKNKILDSSLFLNYQFNANTGESFISRISNSKSNTNKEFYKFTNLQQLKNLLRNDEMFNLD